MTVRLAELLTRDAEPETIQKEIYSTVVEAVKARLVGTNLLALRIGPDGIPGSSVDVVTQDSNSITVSQIAEGAEFPIDTEALSTFNMKPTKYGGRPVITKEMMEDAKWDMVERNLQEFGYQMQRQLDTLILAQIEAGSTAASNNVTGGAALTVNNIVTAMASLETNNYAPTDFIIHPNVAADIRNLDTFVEADKAGVTNPSQSLIGTIFGMRVWVSTQVTSNYAYVVDRNHALVLAEKRPITVERYNDVTRDLSGIAISARWSVRYLRAAANAVITTT